MYCPIESDIKECAIFNLAEICQNKGDGLLIGRGSAIEQTEIDL